jgi:hypothetical protein
LAGFIVDDPLADVLTIRLSAKSTAQIPNRMWLNICLKNYFS